MNEKRVLGFRKQKAPCCKLKTMISNLPSDLVSEILSRVPLKSLRAVRLTCKKWNDLSKAQSFRKMHIGKASAAAKEGETQMMAMMGNNLYLTSIFLDGDPSAEHKGKISCCTNAQVEISQVYHCGGLLLCILKDDHSRVLVWNPYLGQKRWIEPRTSHCPNGWFWSTYALGYEDKISCRSFKLLRFIDYCYSRTAPGHCWYEMYDFESDLWRTLDATPQWRIWSNGVSLKGNTYWCAAERHLEDEDIFDRVIYFDFTRETSGQLLPLPFSGTGADNPTLSCVRDEKLAVLLQHDESNQYELAIWITTKIGDEEVSWCKFLRVEETGFDKRVPCIGGAFLIDEEKKIAMGFDEHNSEAFDIIGDAGYFRQLMFGVPRESGDPKCVCSSYVPSSVEIKRPKETIMIKTLIYKA